jgi:hypothetical protein
MLFEMGPLRREHIQALLFTPGGASRAQVRLTRLYQNKYIDKLPGRPMNSPDVYFVSRRCWRALNILDKGYGEAGVKDRLRPPGKVPHALLVNECRIAFILGAKALGFELKEWRDELDLGWMGKQYGMVPDGYFPIQRPTVEGPKTACFFLEVERSKASGRAITERLVKYRDFYRSGEFGKRFGSKALRVLMVLATQDTARPVRRMQAFIKIAEANHASLFRFITLDEFRDQSYMDALTSPVWRRPGEAKPVALFE